MRDADDDYMGDNLLTLSPLGLCHRAIALDCSHRVNFNSLPDFS